MTPDQYIKAHLLTLAFREAHHHGGMDNMLAVMFVVRNRVHAGWQGGDWLRVMQDHYKFKAESRQRVSLMTFPDLREPIMRELLPIVDEIYSGQRHDPMTDGAVYYAELDKVRNRWFKANVLNKLVDHPRVARVGLVDFFR